MNRLLLLPLCFIAAAALGSCSAKRDEPGQPRPAATATSSVAALPDCSKVEAKSDADGWKHPDCSLRDARGRSFEVHYGETKEGADGRQTPVSIAILGGPSAQVILEQMSDTFSAPSLADIDGDGAQELLVPLETGNVNTEWSVWTPAQGGKFVAAGQISGVETKLTKDGLIAVPARSSAASWSIAFLKMEGGKLTPVATAEVEARPSSKAGAPLKTTCKLTDDGGLSALGLKLDAATRKFCAEPASQVFSDGAKE